MKPHLLYIFSAQITIGILHSAYPWSHVNNLQYNDKYGWDFSFTNRFHWLRTTHWLYACSPSFKNYIKLFSHVTMYNFRTLFPACFREFYPYHFTSILQRQGFLPYHFIFVNGTTVSPFITSARYIAPLFAFDAS